MMSNSSSNPSIRSSSEHSSIGDPNSIIGIEDHGQQTDITIDNILNRESMSNRERNNIETSQSKQSKPIWKRCQRKGKLLAAKTIQAIVPITWRMKRVDKEEVKRLERCEVEYMLIEKRKGLHPIVQVLDPGCEQNSAEPQESDLIELSSEDLNRSETQTLSVQITSDERDMSEETDLRDNGFGLLDSNSRSEFKGLELTENPKSGLIFFDFLKAHRDWDRLTSDRSDTEDLRETSTLSEQSLFPTGADQIGDEGLELRSSSQLFNILSIDSSILYSDWFMVLECADIQDQEETSNVINLSLFFDADIDRNEDIESAENAITEKSIAQKEKVVIKDEVETSHIDEEQLDTVVNRLLASYPIQRPKVRHSSPFDSMANSSHTSNQLEPLDSVVDRVLSTYPMHNPDLNLKFITDKELPSVKVANGNDNRILSGSSLEKMEEEIHFYFGFASNYHWNFSFMDRNRFFGRGLK